MARIVLVYTAAGAAAWLCVRGFSFLHPLLVVGIADIAATLLVFAFSMLFNNSSVYDPYWSAAPVPIALYYIIAVRPPEAGVGLRQVVILALVFVWGARLTWNWIRRWDGGRCARHHVYVLPGEYPHVGETSTGKKGWLRPVQEGCSGASSFQVLLPKPNSARKYLMRSVP